MRKSALQPRSRKTPRGGRMTARMILQISLQSRQRYSASSLQLNSKLGFRAGGMQRRKAERLSALSRIRVSRDLPSCECHDE